MAAEYELVMTSKEIAEDPKKWVALRKTGIGGSDAAVVLGLSSWRNPVDLWLDKTGQKVEPEEDDPAEEPDNVPENEFIYWGTRLEAILAEEFEKRTGKKVRRMGMIRSKKYPWMLADVDRVVEGENALLEIKTTAGWNKDKWDGDNIPEAYFCQVAHYLACTGFERGYIVCLLGGNKFLMKTIERNDEDINYLIHQEDIFWNRYVLTKQLPPADASASYKQVFAKRYPGGQEELIRMPDEVEQLCEERRAVMDAMAPLETKKQELENKIREKMGNNEIARGQKFTISFRTKSYSKVDAVAFEKADKELYEKCLKPVISRRLLIKTIKMRKKGE